MPSVNRRHPTASSRPPPPRRPRRRFTSFDSKGEDGLAPDGTFPPGEDLVEREMRRLFNVDGDDEEFAADEIDELKVSAALALSASLTDIHTHARLALRDAASAHPSLPARVCAHVSSLPSAVAPSSTPPLTLWCQHSPHTRPHTPHRGYLVTAGGRPKLVSRTPLQRTSPSLCAQLMMRLRKELGEEDYARIFDQHKAPPRACRHPAEIWLRSS